MNGGLLYNRRRSASSRASSGGDGIIRLFLFVGAQLASIVPPQLASSVGGANTRAIAVDIVSPFSGRSAFHFIEIDLSCVVHQTTGFGGINDGSSHTGSGGVRPRVDRDDLSASGGTVKVDRPRSAGSSSRQTTGINPEGKDIFSFKYEDFELQNYQAHPHISAPVAV